MQTIIARPAEAYVSAPVSQLSSPPHSCVSLSDLIEVLVSYYEGSLDEPNPFLKVNLPLYEWSSNSLWNALSSEDISAALNHIPLELNNALESYLSHRDMGSCELDLVIEALDLLSEVIEPIL